MYTGDMKLFSKKSFPQPYAGAYSLIEDFEGTYVAGEVGLGYGASASLSFVLIVGNKYDRSRKMLQVGHSPNLCGFCDNFNRTHNLFCAKEKLFLRKLS